MTFAITLPIENKSLFRRQSEEALTTDFSVRRSWANNNSITVTIGTRKVKNALASVT